MTTLPAALWLLVLLLNDGAGRPVLTILGAVGLILVGAVIGWVWGPKCDASSGWRTATLVAWVAFTAAILAALVVSVAAVSQRLTDADLSSDQVRAAPSELLGLWFVLFIVPFLAIWLGAVPIAWIWRRLMNRSSAGKRPKRRAAGRPTSVRHPEHPCDPALDATLTAP